MMVVIRRATFDELGAGGARTELAQYRHEPRVERRVDLAVHRAEARLVQREQGHHHVHSAALVRPDLDQVTSDGGEARLRRPDADAIARTSR